MSAYRVGLTGGLACGKSTVAALLAAHGAEVCDADAVVGGLTAAGGRALPLLRQAATRCPDLVRAHIAFQDASRRVGGDAERNMVAFYGEL